MTLLPQFLLCQRCPGNLAVRGNKPVAKLTEVTDPLIYLHLSNLPPRQIQEQSSCALIPSTPPALSCLVPHPCASTSPAILCPWPQELFLGLCVAEGPKHQHTQSSKASGGEPVVATRLGAACLKAIPFNTQFLSTMRAALEHIAGILRVIQIWEVA